MKGAITLIIISALFGLLPLVSFGIAAALSIPFLILMVYCWVVLYIKRFHDGGKSGWLSILPILAYLVVGYFVGDMVSNMFSGVSPEETQAAMEAAAESGDLKAVMAAGADAAKKTAIPSAISGALVSFAIAFLTNMFIKRDDHENQFGPAS